MPNVERLLPSGRDFRFGSVSASHSQAVWRIIVFGRCKNVRVRDVLFGMKNGNVCDSDQGKYELR